MLPGAPRTRAIVVALLGVAVTVFAVTVSYAADAPADRLLAATVMAGYACAAVVRLRRRPDGAGTVAFLAATLVFSSTWLFFPFPPVYAGRPLEALWALVHGLVFFMTSALYVHLATLLPDDVPRSSTETRFVRVTYAALAVLAAAALLLHLNAHHRLLSGLPAAPAEVQALVRRAVVWCYATFSIVGALLAARAGLRARSANARRQAIGLAAGLGPYGVFRLTSLVVPGFSGSHDATALEWVAPYLLPVGLFVVAGSTGDSEERSHVRGTVSLLALGQLLAGGYLLVFTLAVALRTQVALEWALILAAAVLAAVLVPALRHLGGFIDLVFYPERVERREKELLALVDERTERLREALADAEKARREAEGERARAEEANRAKSLFLANMSHELRTPLTGVLGFAQLMDRTPDRSAEDRHHLDVILHSGEHLLGLINDVLSLSKIEAGRIALEESPFDLTAQLRLLEDMMRVRAAGRHLWLRVETPPDLPAAVRGDEGRLRQILLNLLANAVKFTDQGGVTLRARWAEGPATFEVEDTGRGIAPDELPTVFEPFQQTESGRRSSEGTGLGLSLSRQLARLMGGDITVESRAGAGTTFRVEVLLPEAEARAIEPEERRRVIALAPGPAPRVLVVDDIPANRELLRTLLESVGFVVREAPGGDEAVEAWRAWRPQFIWMDKRMPGTDGLDATRRIREEERQEGNAAVPIVALSASALEHERGEILAAGCDDFLPKPFHEAALFAKMRQHLGLRYVYEEAPEAAAATAAEPLPPGSASGRGRILLVDDDRICRLVSEEALKALDLEVTAVASGEAALDALEKVRYDLVFMDLQMPGLDGVETTRRIRELPGHRDIPVIAMTADEFDGERARFAATGMDDHLGKPIDPDALAEAVGRWLPEPTRSRPS